MRINDGFKYSKFDLDLDVRLAKEHPLLFTPQISHTSSTEAYITNYYLERRTTNGRI